MHTLKLCIGKSDKTKILEILEDGKTNSVAGTYVDFTTNKHNIKHVIPESRKRAEELAILFAAAPELLGFLKELLNSDIAMREEDEGEESELLNKARKLVAKAEGK